jgi:hypothetical protein
MGEVLLILQDQIRRYGGAYGVRDTDLLSSALAMPSASFEGKYLHKDLYEQGAAYAFHIARTIPLLMETSEQPWRRHWCSFLLTELNLRTQKRNSTAS